MDWFKWVAGVAMIVVGVYWVIIGEWDKGIEMIMAGLALLGFIFTLVWAVKVVDARLESIFFLGEGQPRAPPRKTTK